jgi:hypothetical protein
VGEGYSRRKRKGEENDAADGNVERV